MGPTIEDTREGGGGCKDIRVFLHNGRSGESYIWVGYLSRDPLHGADPGGVPLPVGETDNMKIPPSPVGRDMKLPSACGGHVGSGA